MKIPTKDILPNKMNMRSKVTRKSLFDLSESIRKFKGNVIPIRVRPKGEKFEIVYGYRRWLACCAEGIREMNCEIVKVTDEELLEQSLIENILREPLLAEDQARAFRILMDKFGYNALTIAKMCGKKSEVWTYQQLGILKLPKKIREMMKGVPLIEIRYNPCRFAEVPQAQSTKLFSSPKRRLKTSTAIKISEKVKDKKKAVEIARAVIRRGLTQKKTIELIEKLRKFERGEEIDMYPPPKLVRGFDSYKHKIEVLLLEDTLKFEIKGKLYGALLRVYNLCHKIDYKRTPFMIKIAEVALDIGLWYLLQKPELVLLDKELNEETT